MPIPKLFGTDEFAQLVGLDDRSVRRLVKQGILTRDEKGFPPAAIEQYIAHRERAAEERRTAKPEQSSSPSKPARRSTREKCRKALISFAVMLRRVWGGGTRS
jgi:hypothetical protein